MGIARALLRAPGWMLVPVLVLAGLHPAGAAAGSPERLLIYGDSITQGSSGDWTWRYRLWEHLEPAVPGLDFVGPRNDLEPYPGSDGAQAYADSNFDRDHASVWGMQFGRPAYDLSDLVAAYHPNVVVALIGLNDLLYGLLTPDQLAEHWRVEIAAARSSDPDTSFVLVQVPETWYPGVAAYDAELVALAGSLDTPASRVVTTSLPLFDPGTDTWDGTHPTATGEVKIAAAVADSLAGLGIGTPYPASTAEVPNGPRAVATLRAVSGDGSARLSWSSPAGVSSAWIEGRDLTAGTDWSRIPYAQPPTGTWTGNLLTNGDHYQFRVRPAKGTAIATDLTSNVVDLRPGTPAAIVGISAVPGDRRLVMSWRADALALAYRVTWRPADRSTGSRTTTVTGSTATLAGLVAGQRYHVEVRGIRAELTGTPGQAVAVAGGVRPPAPAIRRWAVKPGGTLRLTWLGVPSATRYVVRVRNLGNDGAWRNALFTGAERRRGVIRGLASGRRYALRVRADNELIVGTSSSPIRLRVPRWSGRQ